MCAKKMNVLFVTYTHMLFGAWTCACLTTWWTAEIDGRGRALQRAREHGLGRREFRRWVASGDGWHRRNAWWYKQPPMWMDGGFVFGQPKVLPSSPGEHRRVKSISQSSLPSNPFIPYVICTAVHSCDCLHEWSGPRSFMISFLDACKPSDAVYLFSARKCGPVEDIPF